MHVRHGARQPERFDPARAAKLDDPARFEYLPVSEVAALLDVPQGGLLVDFGTGTGAYARELALLRPDVTVVAFDEQPEMLALLEKKSPLPNLRPTLSSEPYAGRADRVLALNVLHELGDEALRSSAGLLKPGGKAVFIDWNAEVERPIGPPRDHVYSPSEAKARLSSLGWRVDGERTFRWHYAYLCSR